MADDANSNATRHNGAATEHRAAKRGRVDDTAVQEGATTDVSALDEPAPIVSRGKDGCAAAPNASDGDSPTQKRLCLESARAPPLPTPAAADPPWLADLRSNISDHLEICGRTLDPEDTKKLLEVLAAKTGLTSFTFSRNKIAPEDLKAILMILVKLKRLSRLDLSGNNIGPEGAKAIAPSLAELKGLKHLDLRGNYIGPEDAKAIAQSLAQLKELKHLDLHGPLRVGAAP